MAQGSDLTLSCTLLKGVASYEMLGGTRLICLEGKSMTLGRGYTFFFRSSQQLTRLRLGPLTRLVHCFRKYRKQRHRQVCLAKRGGTRTLSKTADANLDCAFVEIALFYTNP